MPPWLTACGIAAGIFLLGIGIGLVVADRRNELHSRYEMKRINHQEAYSLDGACTRGRPRRDVSGAR